MSKPDKSVAVVGGGIWGCALAAAASRAGSQVTLISRRSSERPAHGVETSGDLARAASSRLIVLAVPSEHIETIATQLEPHLDGAHFMVHGVRGLVGEQLHTITEVLRAQTPVRRLGALGGPVLADELSRAAPSVMVVGSRYAEVIELVRESFTSRSLRLYGTRDLVGLEWASALTGCLAIALGYAIGTGLGPGVVAAFTTRAVHETARIAVAAGGEKATILGLSGLGDLLAAAAQDKRPEIVFGKALAAGKSIAEARDLAGARMEALDLLQPLRHWITRMNVRSLIIPAMVEVFEGRRSHDETIHHLMNAPVMNDS